MSAKTKRYRLSPSALNIFKECRRCFWLDKVRGVKRPRGIFPSLPSGMDRVIKDYCDRYRAQGSLPPELSGGVLDNAQLYKDQVKLERWRNWRTGLTWVDKDGCSLFGALDDLLTDGDRFVPFDYKTKGTPTTAEAAVRYYTNQIDCYTLLLEENGMPTAGYGFLLYYSPKEVGEGGQVRFEMQAVKLKTDPERARKTFRSALQLLSGSMPSIMGTCEYCSWIERIRSDVPDWSGEE